MRKNRLKRGHTLLEVMFGIFMVAVCAFIFAASMPTANKSRAKADQRNVATSLAEKMAETIKHNGYANVTAGQMYALGLLDSTTPVSGTTYSWSNIGGSVIDSPATVLPSGTGRMTITQVDLDMRSVQLDVNWVERGQNRTVRVSMLIANL